MVTDFFKWYEKRVDEFEFDPILVMEQGKKQFDETKKDAGYIYYGGDTFIFKRSSSKHFKCHPDEYTDNKKLRSMFDNRLALGSELLSEKKYRAYGIMCARHEIVKRNTDYFVVSPNLFKGYVDYRTYAEVLCDPYDEAPEQKKELKKATYVTLKKLLKNKKHMLSIMTEQCFDEYIMSFLASIFEFSDDEHYNNIMFCRNKNTDKFESVFVYDKESTVFNPLISKGLKYDDVKYETMCFDRYSGRSVYVPEECFLDRVSELGSLIKKGILDKKYVDFLNTIAGFDFCEAAKQIYDETGKKVNQIQLDMYRYGAEQAGELAQRQ